MKTRNLEAMLMEKREVEFILEQNLDASSEERDKPSISQWNKLSKKFNKEFPETFIWFMELLTKFNFEGEILNVSDEGKNNGIDTIAFTYDHEMKYGPWNEKMIPFLAIGNGDYLCLSRAPLDPAVYFHDHETQEFQAYTNSFDEWLKIFPEWV